MKMINDIGQGIIGGKLIIDATYGDNGKAPFARLAVSVDNDKNGEVCSVICFYDLAKQVSTLKKFDRVIATISSIERTEYNGEQKISYFADCVVSNNLNQTVQTKGNSNKAPKPMKFDPVDDEDLPF